jgi:hypothetical protein
LPGPWPFTAFIIDYPSKDLAPLGWSAGTPGVANREKPVYAKYIEHIPPDVTACIFWLKNRDPQHWRDSQQHEHVLGRYIISDQPMTEEQWARERATVIDDDPPRFGDGRVERYSPLAKPK